MTIAKPEQPGPFPGHCTPFGLRPATHADCGFLWSLTTRTIRDSVAAFGDWDDALREEQFRSVFDPVRWWVLSVDGQDAGGVALERHPQALFLADLLILPEHQRKGIGSAVVRALLADAWNADVPLVLQVLDSNPGARRLYERLGFSVCFASPMPHYSVMVARPGGSQTFPSFQSLGRGLVLT